MGRWSNDVGASLVPEDLVVFGGHWLQDLRREDVERAVS
jgi:hypothetical protein